MVHLKNEAFMLAVYRDMAEWAVEDQAPNLKEDDRSSDQQIEEQIEEPKHTVSLTDDLELEIPVLDVECVTNWDTRIEGYSELQKRFYERMVPKLDEIL